MPILTLQRRSSTQPRSHQRVPAPRADVAVSPEKAARARRLADIARRAKSKERTRIHMESRQEDGYERDRRDAAMGRIYDATRLLDLFSDVPDVRERAVHYLATAMTDQPYTASQCPVWNVGLERLEQLDAQGEPQALSALAAIATAKVVPGHEPRRDAVAESLTKRLRHDIAQNAMGLVPDVTGEVLSFLSDRELLRNTAGRYATGVDGNAAFGWDLHRAQRVGQHVGAGLGYAIPLLNVITAPLGALLGRGVGAMVYGTKRGVERLRERSTHDDASS